MLKKHKPLSQRRRSHVMVAALALVAVAGCTPDVGPGTPQTTTTTTQAPDPHAVEGVQLAWSYSQYAQYGVFGPWAQSTSGPNVSINVADGQTTTGLASEAGRVYTMAQFDNGTGTIDPVTGEGTVTWESGDWVLNAYNGQFGAPDETLSDPVLTIGADGSGTLSFVATIPPGLDMEGNPAPGAGPERVTVATFDNVDSITGSSLRITPDFAGRTYTHPLGFLTSTDCDGAGGSWPAEWIDFVPDSVKSHYFTTSCEGLNLRKPATPFEVTWNVDSAISLQPSLTKTALFAGESLAAFGARVGVTGAPTPSVQWQSSPDGAEWTDIAGATSTRLDMALTATYSGHQFRAVVGETQYSDIIGPITVTQIEGTIVFALPAVETGLGESAAMIVSLRGAPQPTVVWERSDDGGTTWGPIDPSRYIQQMVSQGNGSFGALLNLRAAELNDNGAKFRARVSNGIGTEKVSQPSTLTVHANMPVIKTQPIDSGGFSGQTARFYADFDAKPKATSFRWQHSIDDGETWTDLDSQATGANPVELIITGSELTEERNGELVRAAVTNSVGTAYSDPARIVVLERTGTRRVVIISPQQLSPAGSYNVTAAAEGFTPEDGDDIQLEFSFRDAATWQPGQALPTDQPFGGRRFSAQDLRSNGGVLSGTFWVASGRLNQANTYGLVVGSTDPSRRDFDTWTPVEVVWG